MKLSDSIPDLKARQQAVDPGLSCIVQAPAGAGKTTLLARRYVELLRTVQRPEAILAITFTIKAAAEMRQRVLKLLREDSPEAFHVRQRADALDWQIFSNPNVLKIQTIDSFALEISSRGHAPDNLTGYTIAEDPQAFYEDATTSLLVQLMQGDATANIIAGFLAFLDNDAESLARLVPAMLAKRDQWLELAKTVSRERDKKVITQILAQTISGLREDAVADATRHLVQEDFAWFALLSDDAHWFSALPALMTKAGTLRKKIDTQTITDLETRKRGHQWLQNLHDRGLSEVLQKIAQLPQEAELEAQSDELINCCVCLTLAASELVRIFKQEGVTDFTGLLLSAKAVLRDQDGNPTDLALMLDYRIGHLLIDEFQDTSRGQQQLFELLVAAWQMDDSNTFFAVGDPMQSIYRFRDADVEIFAEAKQHGIADRGLTVCNLTANFRSDPVLVDWVNQVFLDSEDGVDTPVSLTSYHPASAVQPADPQATVKCLRFDNSTVEVNACVNQVLDLLKQGEGSIAILCRARGHLAPLLEAFRRQGIDWQAADMDLLASSGVVMDLMSALELLLDPSQRLAWYGLLRSPMFGLELAELLALGQEDIAAQLTDSGDLRLQRLEIAFHWARDQLFEISLAEVLEGFWLRCGGADAYLEDELPNALAFLDLISSLPTARLSVEAVRSAIEKLFAKGQRESRINILTIHKAKGLEFDHVLVPHLNSRTRPDSPSLLLWRQTRRGVLMGVRGDSAHTWLQSLNRQAAALEERRLLYVACTRAKTSLYLSFVQSANGKTSGLARYLADYAEDSTPQGDETASLVSNRAVLQQDLLQTREYARLPGDYVWQAPATTGLRQRSLPDRTGDPIAHRLEVEVGVLVHRVLAYLGHHELPLISGEEIKRLFMLWYGTGDNQAASIATAQLQKLLASEIGQWAISPHDQHESESRYQTVVDGTLSTIVLDRMFVENGTRWILDYKTGQQADLQAVRERYRPQLERYARAMATIYPEPIKAGLLLTDLPQLEIVEL